MTGSMYAAVAGLKTHMNALNVIGNNISNVNTYGYKAGRYTFNEALYTMVYSGSNGTEQLGGRNPAQIGYGCSLGTIDLDVSTKTFSATAQGLDCMIDGDGFFIVGDKTHLGINRQAELNGMDLTRLGNFEFKGGYMVDGNGQVVYGFLNTAEYDAAAPNYSTVLTPIRLPYYNNQSKEVYMPEVNTENEENPQVVDSQEAQELLNEQLGEPGTMVSIERLNVDTMTLDSTGCITCVTRDNIQVIIGYIAIGKVDSPNGVTHTDGRYYKALGGAGNVHLTTIGGSGRGRQRHCPGDRHPVSGGRERRRHGTANRRSGILRHGFGRRDQPYDRHSARLSGQYPDRHRDRLHAGRTDQYETVRVGIDVPFPPLL